MLNDGNVKKKKKERHSDLAIAQRFHEAAYWEQVDLFRSAAMMPFKYLEATLKYQRMRLKFKHDSPN